MDITEEDKDYKEFLKAHFFIAINDFLADSQLIPEAILEALIS